MRRKRETFGVYVSDRLVHRTRRREDALVFLVSEHGGTGAVARELGGVKVSDVAYLNGRPVAAEDYVTGVVSDARRPS